MAQVLYHKDLGNGRVIEFYDDGSAGEWDIDTGAGFHDYPSGTFNVKNAQPQSTGGSGSSTSGMSEEDFQRLERAYARTEGYNYAKLAQDKTLNEQDVQGRLDIAKIGAGNQRYSSDTQRKIAAMDNSSRWDIANLTDQTSRLKIAADLQDMERRTALALVQAGSQLSQSPRDMMRAISLSEGVRGDPTLSGVLGALMTGRNTAGFAGPAAGLTGAADVGSLLSHLLGTDPNAPTGQQMSDQAATADYIGQNPHKVQGFQNLGRDTQQGVLSVLESRGTLANNWLDQYLRSRPGQGSAAAA